MNDAWWGVLVFMIEGIGLSTAFWFTMDYRYLFPSAVMFIAVALLLKVIDGDRHAMSVV